MRPTPHRLPALDGIRGIAIAAVILFHWNSFAAGWIGVQLFFVLSGFLITESLLRDVSRPFWSYLGAFYLRRVLRIFPVYYLFLAGLALYFAVRGEARIGHHWPQLLTFTINVGRASQSWAGDTYDYVSHFWSLAVEEQFYLTWPLLLWLTPGRYRLVLCLSLIGAGPLFRAATFDFLQARGHDAAFIGNTIYTLTFCQIDAFGAGAAVAFVTHRRGAAAFAALAWTTFALAGRGR